MKQQIPNDEISLKELFEKLREWYTYLLSQWKTIVLAGVIGAVLGLAYSLIKKPVYTATLTFALEDDKSSGGLGGALGLASSFGLDLGGDGGSIFSGSNLTELFKSRTMVEKTLMTPVTVNGKIISLAEMYIQNNKWRESWNDEPKFKNMQFLPNTKRKYFTRVHDSIIGEIYQDLSEAVLSVTQRNKKIAIISVDVESTNELFSFYFCQALAREVGKFYVDTKSKETRMNMEILERQTDSIRAELSSAITGVAVATDKTFNLNPALNARKAPSVRKQIDVEANSAVLAELVTQTELAKVNLRKATPLIQVIDRPVLPLPKEQFGKAKGILLGGVLGGFLVLIYLIIKQILKVLV